MMRKKTRQTLKNEYIYIINTKENMIKESKIIFLWQRKKNLSYRKDKANIMYKMKEKCDEKCKYRIGLKPIESA